MKGNPNAIKFEELMAILLQEEQSRQNRSNMCVADEAFMASQRGKAKASTNSKPKPASSNNSKSEKGGDKQKKKGKCNWCRELGHFIKDCPKLKEKESKKKESSIMQNLQILCRM